MKALALVFLVLLGFNHQLLGQSTGGESHIGLSAAIDMALKNNTRARIAEADKKAAEAASGILSSDYLPRINSSVSYTRSQYPQIVTPIRKQGVFPPLDDQVYEATVQAEWEIVDFGESRAARNSAKALAAAANIRYELARMETIEATTSHFVQLQQLKELERVQQERIQTLQKSKEQLKSMHVEGRVAKVDLLKIEETIVDAETAVLETENGIDEVLQTLSHDLGRDQKLKMKDMITLSFRGDNLYDPDQISEEAVPPVAAAYEQWRASKYESKASYRAFLPQLNLFAVEQFRAGSEFEIDDQWMVGLRMNIPLFAGKRIVDNQVKRNKSKAKKIELEKTRQDFVQQLNKLTNAQYEAKMRIESSQVRKTYLEETYRVEKVSYREGRTTLTDLLTTESKLNGVNAEWIAMRAQLKLINLNIAVLTGQLNKELALKLATGESL